VQIEKSAVRILELVFEPQLRVRLQAFCAQTDFRLVLLAHVAVSVSIVLDSRLAAIVYT